MGLAAIGGGLCFWLWGRTGEILIDFGNELYIPWQLSTGQVLYRDVQCVYGPLSVNFNAFMMRLLGPGLPTILFTNLLVLVAVVVLLYPLLRAISGTWTAFVATSFFLVVFALSSPIPMANYNFLTPYTHSITHGFLLCIATIWCVDRFYRRGSIWAVIGGGFLTGAAFLTKPEMALACAATFGLGVAGAMWTRRDRRTAKVVAAALASASAPVLNAWIVYSMWMPAFAALRAISGGWQYLNKPFVSATPFYSSQLGTDYFGDSLLRLVIYGGLYAGFGFFLWLVGCLGAIAAGGRRSVAMILGLLVAVGVCWNIRYIGDRCESFWPDAARGFPLFAVAAIIATGVQLIRRRAADGRRAVLQWTLSVLSLALLLKIFFNVRVYHYGFVLAAPCGLLAVIALLDWFPSSMRLRGTSALIARLGAMGLLAAVMIEHILLTHRTLAEHSIGIPLVFGGTAYAEPASVNAAVAIQWLRAHNGTVAVLPDAAGINYAAGRTNSTRYIVVLPMVLAMYGEQNVLRDFQRNAPDFILIMSFDERAFGPRFLGVDYGVELFQWIQKNYRSIGIFEGERPIQLCRHIGT
jgi:hypothetical protein